MKHRRTLTGYRSATACAAVALAMTLGASALSSGSASASNSKPKVAAHTIKAVNIIQYVDGKAGPANKSLSPVTVGWVNTQGGPGGAPESTVAAEAAVKWINAQLGGIHGHPLKLDTCFVVSSEAQVQQCGEQMVNTRAIKLVNVSYMQVVGAQPLYQLTGPRKPLLGTTASTPAEFAAKNAYFFFVDNYNGNGITTFVSKVQHAKSVAMVAPAGPIAQIAEVTAAQFRQLGVPTTVVAYPSTTTSLTGPLLAAGAQTASVIVPYVLPPDCIRVYQALQQLGIKQSKVTTTPLCTDPAVSQALGGIPVGWTFEVNGNVLNTNDPNIALYRDKLAQFEGKSADPGGEAEVSFGLIMLDARFLNEVGPNDITLKSIRSAADAFRGPEFLGPPGIQCGVIPGEPTACALSTQMNTYLGNGKWDSYGGEGFRPPIALK